MAAHAPSAEPVNIGYEEDISIAELVSLICDVSGRRPQLIFDTSKPEGRFRKCPDASTLRRIAPEYRPAISLRDGIEEMVGWYHASFGAGVTSEGR